MSQTTKQYCEPFVKAGLPCAIPEINAIRNDLMTIGQHLENAIAFPYHETVTKQHSPAQIKQLVIQNLTIAKEWFGDIIMYLQVYGGDTFQSLIDDTTKVQSYMDTLIKDAQDTPAETKALQDMTMDKLYGFQGVIGALSDMIEAGFILVERQVYPKLSQWEKTLMERKLPSTPTLIGGMLPHKSTSTHGSPYSSLLASSTSRPPVSVSGVSSYKTILTSSSPLTPVSRTPSRKVTPIYGSPLTPASLNGISPHKPTPTHGSPYSSLMHTQIHQFSATDSSQEQCITLKTASSAKVCEHLTDGVGRAVYMFESDTQGTLLSTCNGTCLAIWPRLTDCATAAGSVEQKLIGFFSTDSGEQQIIYNKWPLYYYTPDKLPGQISGQGIMSFGAYWYLLSPDGEPIYMQIILLDGEPNYMQIILLDGEPNYMQIILPDGEQVSQNNEANYMQVT